MGLGERIEEAIAGSEKSKAQIARECEVTAGAVSQWLSGATGSLKAETALALEQATGYRAYWILHGRGPKTTAEAVHVWPFPKVDLVRFERLDDDDKGYVQRRLLQAIEECEHGSGPVRSVPVSHDIGDDLPEAKIHPKPAPRNQHKRRG